MIRPPHRFEKELIEVRREVARLRLVIPYARHLASCQRSKENDWRCTCGFDALVDEITSPG